ncbi:hypothetical protein [Kocuria turfanensis]|uniref:Uncharacterized protein n=1 Tax=Kocuria turfanensis TaxID=388357 RepID=A0A512IGN5_9MICC|nr:hypothetical protein [Kocuria turfanensis]GEO96865.1 hypothetical protein KTU01_29880 [Kocuria turfanensis]
MTLEKTQTSTAPTDEQTSTDEKPEKKSPALNIPGLLAGAATAATMSVIGGHLSVVGTVLGAALTSIVSGIAVVVYSTSLERSRQGLSKVRTVVTTRILPRDGLRIPETHGSSAVTDEAPGPRFRLPLKQVLLSTGAIIGLAVAAVFGIQALTGTELSGGTGTIQRTVTGSESVAVRSATTPAPADEQAPGTGELAPAEGADPAQAPTTAPTTGELVPGETAPTSGAVTGDGTTTSGDAAAGTGSQPLDGGQTGADAGQLDPGAAQQGATGTGPGAAPAAP